VGFPLIPVSLIIFKSLPLQSFVLRFLVKDVPRAAQRLLEPIGLYEYFQRIYPASGDENLVLPKDIGTISLIARVVCGALLLPTFAVYVGKLLFGSMEDDLKRTLLVCCQY